MCGDLENLELGDTVEYTLSKGKGNKVSAEKVTKVAPGMKVFFFPIFLADMALLPKHKMTIIHLFLLLFFFYFKLMVLVTISVLQ